MKGPSVQPAAAEDQSAVVLRRCSCNTRSSVERVEHAEPFARAPSSLPALARRMRLALAMSLVQQEKLSSEPTTSDHASTLSADNHEVWRAEELEWNGFELVRAASGEAG